MGKKMITIVSVTYQQASNYKLQTFVYNLLSQSYDSWKAIIIHDGPSSDGSKEFMDMICQKHGDQITYIESEEKVGNWGHKNRHRGLMMVDTPWVTMTNSDNLYSDKFIQHIEADMASDQFDVLLWHVAHSYFAYEDFYRGFGCGATDLMQFAVRTEMAQKVGFTSELHHADGILIESLKGTYPHLAKMDRVGVFNGVYGIHN